MQIGGIDYRAQTAELQSYYASQISLSNCSAPECVELRQRLSVRVQTYAGKYSYNLSSSSFSCYTGPGMSMGSFNPQNNSIITLEVRGGNLVSYKNAQLSGHNGIDEESMVQLFNLSNEDLCTWESPAKNCTCPPSGDCVCTPIDPVAVASPSCEKCDYSRQDIDSKMKERINHSLAYSPLETKISKYADAKRGECYLFKNTKSGNYDQIACFAGDGRLTYAKGGVFGCGSLEYYFFEFIG